MTRQRAASLKPGDAKMNATKYSFEMIASAANIVAQYRKEGESAASVVARVMFQYDWGFQGLVQDEIERRDRY
jgi:hypothetical protein